jgi:hypothetical protein
MNATLEYEGNTILQCLEPLTPVHSVTPQKTGIPNYIAAKNSEPGCITGARFEVLTVHFMKSQVFSDMKTFLVNSWFHSSLLPLSS